MTGNGGTFRRVFRLSLEYLFVPFGFLFRFSGFGRAREYRTRSGADLFDGSGG